MVPAGVACRTLAPEIPARHLHLMSGKVDRAAIERDWHKRGFSCGLWTDPPGQEWRDFVHATDELVIPLEGEIELEFAGRTFRPSVGEEILIPARTNHTVRNVGGRTARWLYGYKQGSAAE